MTSITETYKLDDIRNLKGVFLADAVKAFLPAGSSKLTADQKRDALADMWGAQTSDNFKANAKQRLAEEKRTEGEGGNYSPGEAEMIIEMSEKTNAFATVLRRILAFKAQRNGGKLTAKQTKRVKRTLMNWPGVGIQIAGGRFDRDPWMNIIAVAGDGSAIYTDRDL